MKYIIVFLMCWPSVVVAWGKRGHQVVGETAAALVALEPDGRFMKSHGFDFGYYANVPDFIWKRPKTYEFERNQHFMDLPIFEREFAKKPEVAKPYELSRSEFSAKFPEIKEDAGRAYWRVREMNEQLSAVTKSLRELKEPKGKERQALQEKWFVIAGTLAHYVGDLAQPLHVTDNYDGEMTGQKGVHHYFEEEMVDEVYPEIGVAVHKAAVKEWPAFKKKNGGKSVLELLEQLAKNSLAGVKDVLALDKKAKRDPTPANAERFRKLIGARLVEGSLTLAEIYRRQLGWKFDGQRFYFFAGEPEYIMPGK